MPLTHVDPLQVGHWHFTRHPRSETIRVEWKIRPFRQRRDEICIVRNTLHTRRGDRQVHGLYDNWPDTEFASIRIYVNGKPARLPAEAYDDCFSPYPLVSGFDDWIVRRENGATEIATKLGAHGYRSWVTWRFVGGHYAGRKFTCYSWGNEPPRVEG